MNPSCTRWQCLAGWIARLWCWPQTIPSPAIEPCTGPKDNDLRESLVGSISNHDAVADDWRNEGWSMIMDGSSCCTTTAEYHGDDSWTTCGMPSYLPLPSPLSAAGVGRDPRPTGAAPPWVQQRRAALQPF